MLQGTTNTCQGPQEGAAAAVAAARAEPSVAV